MAQEYRYPLTRVCLRGGTMTLPRAMIELFPESGEVVLFDPELEVEHLLEMTHPRVVAGLGEFYRAHDLEVNDELRIEPLDDGRFAVTAAHRNRVADAASPEALAEVLNELAESGMAVTELEIHALYPSLPSDLELTPFLAADPRFEQHGGRWQRYGMAEAGTPTADVTASELAQEQAEVAHAEEQSEEMQHAQVAVGASAEAQGGQTDAQGAYHAAADAATVAQSMPHNNPSQSSAGLFAPHQQAPAGRGGVQERRTPSGSAAEQSKRQPHLAGDLPSYDPQHAGDAALAAVAAATRLRGVLAALGYRIEPLGAGLLNLHAEMGRRNYRVLIQLLPSGERLDWAALLAKRRTSAANYLAVVGDHADLLRLTNPAELARATLWSWEALERLKVLHATVAVTPIDLESHFASDGLFEQGLTRFEQSVAARVAERGATSEVLAHLSLLRAPSVFLLEELASEAGMSREAALRIIERLGEAPFHLVAKVDQGEFLLRQPVAHALASLASYANSLRDRLPGSKREVLTGLGEPDLLADTDMPEGLSETPADA